VVFNTAMTGYQEILTDPSYMSQILAFTFPHVGNTGTNVEDIEQMGGGSDTSARGAIFRDVPTDPANYRSDASFDDWMKRRGVVGLAGVDTRALTKIIRDKGAPHAVIAHDPNGEFDLDALVAQAKAWTGLVGLDLAKPASTLQAFEWDEGLWEWPEGHPKTQGRKQVVVIDYGVKRNILRALASTGARITVVPATTTAEEVLARNPDGVVLSNGPGDPAATGEYAVPETGRQRQAPDGHLPGPPDAGPGPGRQDGEDGTGPPRRQPSGQGSDHRQGRDRVDEPRLHRRSRQPARRRDRNPRQPVRRHQLRHRGQGQADLQRSAPPRGLARAGRQPVSV
jgi:hypothetical protein